MAFPNSRQLVLDLANKDNPPEPGIPTPTFSDVTLDPPIVLPNDHDSLREVSVMVRSIVGGRFKNNRVVYYNRYPLTDFFGEHDSIPYTMDATPAILIESINTRYGLSLTVDEFTYPEFEDETYNGMSFTLIAKPDNFAYKGQKLFYLNSGLIPLETVIVNQVLNGLILPEAIVLETEVEVDVPIIPSMTDGEGALLGGSTHSTEGFVVASNAEVAMALSANLWTSATVFPTVNGKKTITLPNEGSDWNFIYSVGLTGDLAGQRITDHYDVDLIITNKDTDETLTMVLIDSTVNDGNIDWLIVFDGEAHPNGNDITDNSHSESFDTVLNIQRVSFYRENVMPLTSHFPSPPRGTYGSFSITMTATRRNSVTFPVVMTLDVDVIAPPL